MPAVDVYENENGITLKADLPGVSKENLNVRVERDQLTIEGTVALGESAKLALLAYSWPGNVRELENGIRAAVAMSASRTLEASDLPLRVRDSNKARGNDSKRVDLDALERTHIERVLRETGGNRSEAARQLGIDRVTLYRKMKRYEVAD